MSGIRLFKLLGGIQTVGVARTYILVADYIIVHEDGVAEAGILITGKQGGLTRQGVKQLMSRKKWEGDDWGSEVVVGEDGQPAEDHTVQYLYPDSLSPVDDTIPKAGSKFFELEEGGAVGGTYADRAGGLMFSHIIVEPDEKAYLGYLAGKGITKLGTEIQATENWRDFAKMDESGEPVEVNAKGMPLLKCSD